MSKSKFQVAFYADTDLFTNKRFIFKTTGKQDSVNCVKRFQAKGVRIRAAWHRKVQDGYVVDQIKIL